MRAFKFQPFVEVNLIHNTENYRLIMNDVKNSQEGEEDIDELKLGIKSKLSNNVSTWARMAQQWIVIAILIHSECLALNIASN